jgi:uncharacterized membrane protein YhaH (DUF805 family)
VAEFYYLDGARNQQGPVQPDEIARLVRAGTIRRDTMVWGAGMPEWSAAGQVSDLAPLFAQATPPRPAAPPPAGPPMQRPGPGMGGGYQQAAMGGGYQGQPRARAPQYRAAPTMGFGGAIKTCFSKYATFQGRARRPEFWWWYLFYSLVLWGLVVVDGVIAAAGGPFLVLTSLGILGLFLPLLAAGVRRLHDADRSGWMMLITFIPLVGPIILLVFLCQRGTDGPNRFGEDDLALAAEFE